MFHHVGYVVPQKYYFLNEYETQVMGFYGPLMAPYLSEIIIRLGEKILLKAPPYAPLE
jgi:hypothetical protein